MKMYKYSREFIPLSPPPPPSPQIPPVTQPPSITISRQR